jgi:ABC-2 type transport system permease protein
MHSEARIIEYDSATRRSPMLGELLDLLPYRDLLSLLVINILKTRYRRSTLGLLWTLLNPLLNMAVLTVAFSRLFAGALPDYPVYLLAGLICWNFFTQATLSAMHTVVWGGSLMKRIYLPRTVFPIASVGSGLINLGLAMIPLIGIILVVRHPLYSTWYFVPFAVLLLAAFSLGVALLMSTLAVFFVDVVDTYQVLIQAMFFLTPVMYPIRILPVQYAWCMNLNPLYHLIEMFRVPIYAGVLPDGNAIMAATASAVVSLLVGWAAFARKADEFAYRI